jgi:hypothetical protein
MWHTAAHQFAGLLCMLCKPGVLCISLCACSCWHAGRALSLAPSAAVVGCRSTDCVVGRVLNNASGHVLTGFFGPWDVAQAAVSHTSDFTYKGPDAAVHSQGTADCG